MIGHKVCEVCKDTELASSCTSVFYNNKNCHESESVCRCHNEIWHSCPTYQKNFLLERLHYKDIADDPPVIIPEEAHLESDYTVTGSKPEKTLAQINAEKRKIQNRLDANKSLNRTVFPFSLVVVSIVLGLCTIPAFIVLPWMCGLTLIIVSVITMAGASIAMPNQSKLMKAAQIAEYQDKLIDLEAEYEDKMLEGS